MYFTTVLVSFFRYSVILV